MLVNHNCLYNQIPQIIIDKKLEYNPNNKYHDNISLVNNFIKYYFIWSYTWYYYRKLKEIPYKAFCKVQYFVG